MLKPAIKKSKTLFSPFKYHSKVKSGIMKPIEVNPMMVKTFTKMDKIESDINYCLFRHKDKKCGNFLFKSLDVERKINKISKKIEHSTKEIEKHEFCHKKSITENELLNSDHKSKINQGKYLGNEYGYLKNEVENMRKQIIILNNEKTQMEFKAITFKEEIKYIKADINKINKDIDKVKKERKIIIEKLKNEKDNIFSITKGAKLSETFIKKITKLIKTE